MINKLRLMCVLAHPEDESLGVGGTLDRYSREGVQTYLVTATRGEWGRFGDNTNRPSAEEVGKFREAELHCAAKKPGIHEVRFLDYQDGEVDQADPAEIISRIVFHLRWVKPHVVITFGPEGGYGHPDHIAIFQYTTSAVVSAAEPEYKISRNGELSGEAHSVSKLYYMAWPPAKWEAYQAAFPTLKLNADGQEREASPWPDWAITAIIDTTDYWKFTWDAINCHKTQLVVYRQSENLTEKHHQAMWGSQEFYRTFILVNGGRKPESDLFDGLNHN
jgi:LmbE family N-acetylglucosaminyl deacetylase